MLTLIATILGGLTSLGPHILTYLNKKTELDHELKLLEAKAKYADKLAEVEVRKLDAQAAIDEGKGLYAHDMSLDGGKFLNALRASIRPVITYLFFFAWLTIKCIVLYHALSIQHIDLLKLIPLIWDENTASIFGAIMGFHFGSRALERFGYNQTKRTELELKKAK